MKLDALSKRYTRINSITEALKLIAGLAWDSAIRRKTIEGRAPKTWSN